jgi:hypothetical protein
LAHSAPEVLMCLASSLQEPIEKRQNFRQNTTHFTTQNKQLSKLVQIQQSSCQGIESASVIFSLVQLKFELKQEK